MMMNNEDTELVSQKLMIREAQHVLASGSQRLALCYWRFHFGLAGLQVVHDVVTDPDNSVTTLQLWDNCLSELDIQELSFGLRSVACKVERLELDMNDLSDEVAVNGLASVLMCESNQIKSLSLANTNLTPMGFKIIWECFFHKNCKVQHLNLDDNMVNDHSLIYALSTIQESDTFPLERLSLQRNSITKIGLRALIDAAKRIPLAPRIRFSRGSPFLSPLPRRLLLDLAWVNDVAASRWFRVVVTLLAARDGRMRHSSNLAQKMPSELIRYIARSLPLL